ncbi:MAG TPA: penicillin-insensitive murein endopeptidase [Rhodopila sp.]|uniref:penicillin-insensitive murein endopeptidase n=1 Tax=Rhodopila sp. TaxID=2480087 RepID=UPI002C5FBE79|nr:penicillin-insensitive murein endopeptidase [Rhodopila sp.]HVY14811.1 penicillin-insensitive murein endopeptidase [Rhodopila sp.]
MSPLPGPLRIIGGPFTGGCIEGAISLPDHGPGFQTIHLDRSAFYGAPQTIARLELLGQEAAAVGLPTLLVEDISRARGGPLPGGHVSHQVGLDADVGLDMRPRDPLDAAQRESVVLASVVRPDLRGVDPAVWSPRVVELLKLAARLPDVDRILVNPAIKKRLCEDTTGDRSWLHLIRPWYGHAAHMHIRFRCPPGQTECAQAPPPPPGDGCDATLQWWFDQLNAPPKPKKPYHPPPLPAACRGILGLAG